MEELQPRQKRLLNDNKSMERLRDQSNGMLNFSVDQSYQKYKVTISGIEALVGYSSFEKKQQHVFTIELQPEYPTKSPLVMFENTIFHPNWRQDGLFCYGRDWTNNTSLREFVIDIVRMMQYEIVNNDSPWNLPAKNWYLNNNENIYNIIKHIKFPLSIDEADTLDIFEPVEEKDELVLL